MIIYINYNINYNIIYIYYYIVYIIIPNRNQPIRLPKDGLIVLVKAQLNVRVTLLHPRIN